MKGRITILVFCIATVTIGFWHCSPDPVSGGGTIETTNGVVGSVRNGDETPAPDAVVRLFPKEYDPVADGELDERFTDTADTDGTYRFSRIASGLYTVLARNPETATGFLERDVEVHDDSVTNLGEGVLETTGSIAADFSSSGVSDGGYVYLPGTDLSVSVSVDGTALLQAVPPGVVPAVMLSADSSEKRNVLRDRIEVVSGDTTVIDLPLWNYRRTIVLNTSDDGAGVREDVYDFPVLVRLSDAVFDFSQAEPDGSDLRFTTLDGRSMACEIELWDASGNRAAVWVKVDTVYGNDSTHFFMYWGNPDASGSSVRGAVFDTTDGFAGIWHLSDVGEDSIRDATLNNYHGVSPESARPRPEDGLIGNCASFDGVGDYIRMPNTAAGKLNYPENGTFTISAWVAVENLNGTTNLIVAKGYDQYFLRLTYFPSDSPLWEFSEFNKFDIWQTCTTTAVAGEWVLLTGVANGDGQRLFCNGVAVDSTPDSYQKDGLVRGTSHDLTIGRFMESITLPDETQSNCFLRGSVDEVRIESRARSPEWIRLCYMNQRSDDRLVEFK